MGVWDQFSIGLFNSHSVGLWSSTGTLLASVLVPSGSGSTLVNEYRHATLTTLTLLSGQSYVFGASYLNDDTDVLITPQPPEVGAFSPTVIAGNRRTSQNLGFSFPTQSFPAGSYSGPNALMTVVLEPSTFGLIGIATVLALRQKRHRV